MRDVPFRTCYEPGPNGTVTMRAVNNRSYGQMIFAQPSGSFAGRELQGFELSLDRLAKWMAYELISTDSRVYVPRAETVDVDVERPSRQGAPVVMRDAFNVSTVVLDSLFDVIEQIDIGALLAVVPGLNAAVRTLFEAVLNCGQEALRSLGITIGASSASGFSAIIDTMRLVGELIGKCFTELTKALSDPDSQQRKAIKEALKDQAPSAASKFTRRFVRAASKILVPAAIASRLQNLSLTSSTTLPTVSPTATPPGRSKLRTQERGPAL